MELLMQQLVNGMAVGEYLRVDCAWIYHGFMGQLSSLTSHTEMCT